MPRTNSLPGGELGIPTIVNICKVPVGPRYLTANPPTRILAVSTFAQTYLRTRHGLDSIVVNPIIQFDEPPFPPEPRFLTVFNPVKAKGGQLFRALAERLPGHQFAWVPGWDILLNTSFNIAGDPIVETPEDALDTFLRTDIDYLVIEDVLIRKK